MSAAAPPGVAAHYTSGWSSPQSSQPQHDGLTYYLNRNEVYLRS
jgi:hypothetical protein